MIKIRKKSFFILFILVILSFLIFLNEISNIKREKANYSITIITDNKINESSITMKAGAEKAAEEMNAEIRFITLSKSDFIEEQKELLSNENNIDTDAILISPIIYNSLKDEVEKVNKKIPVIILNSDKQKDLKRNTVNFDNYNMGVLIGNKILNSTVDDKNIMIIKDSLQGDVTEERYDGLISTLEGRYPYNIVEVEERKNVTYYEQIKQLLNINKSNIVVSFNAEILEIIAQVKSEYLSTDSELKNIEVYGSGSSRKIISFLDQNIIDGIALENQFNIGYLGVKDAVNYINDKHIKNDVISSELITHDNMYSKENQRLLFLFVR